MPSDIAKSDGPVRWTIESKIPVPFSNIEFIEMLIEKDLFETEKKLCKFTQKYLDQISYFHDIWRLTKVPNVTNLTTFELHS